mgnify:CR=1 FL=1
MKIYEIILSYQIINGSVEQHGCISSWPIIRDDLIKKLAWVFDCPYIPTYKLYSIKGIPVYKVRAEALIMFGVFSFLSLRTQKVTTPVSTTHMTISTQQFRPNNQWTPSWPLIHS